jgi:hypothetical protein
MRKHQKVLQRKSLVTYFPFKLCCSQDAVETSFNEMLPGAQTCSHSLTAEGGSLFFP